MFSYSLKCSKALVDYEGDSEEEEDAEQISGETEENEPKKDIDLTVVAPDVSHADGEDYDVESPNKRAKLT